MTQEEMIEHAWKRYLDSLKMINKVYFNFEEIKLAFHAGVLSLLFIHDSMSARLAKHVYTGIMATKDDANPTKM
jgi:hypothetical protein